MWPVFTRILPAGLPESGDVVQAMKAGIMEMADIFVISKADLAGAPKMATDIKRVAALSRREAGSWQPSVLLVSASRPESVTALSEEIDRHQAWLAASQRREVLLEQRARYRLRRLIERRVAEVVARQPGSLFQAPLREQLHRTLREISEIP